MMSKSTLTSNNIIRRKLLTAGAGLAAWVLLPPAMATPEGLTSAINAFTGGAKVSSGKVVLDVAKLVDNGNTVPITVTVDSPMTAAEHVTSIAVFNERNPEPEVARFTLGPRAGKASVSTRMRLATSQKLVAVARLSDGTFWSNTADVVVTLAACLEEEV
jgi:sulfur-oxidizing protein SoxY